MIRWIKDGLGTAPACDCAITEEFAVLDVRDLVDKHGNSPDAIREKIEAGVALLEEGRRVVVCCDYGISRSNAVAAGILSRFAAISLDDALIQVVRATGEQEMKLEPIRSVRAALDPVPAESPAGEQRILVTGGSGFVGEALLRKLSRRYHTAAPTRGEADLMDGSLALDLLVKRERINCVVHLANPRVYTSNRATGESVTLLRNVLDVCKENGARLVYPSGWEVYSAYRATGIVADESLPLFPKGPYGEAKLLCENLINVHRKVHGLDCCIARSSPLYGESCDRPKFIWNFMRKAKRNEPIVTHCYRNGSPKLDLLYVDDFITALMLLIDNRFVGDLNIGFGRAVSTLEVAHSIVRRMGSHSSVSSKPIDDFVANVTMDTTLARKVLSWQPDVPWEMGLDRLLQNFENQRGSE